MGRKAKLRKLNAFRRHLPHITRAALSALLVAVSLDGLQDLTDRSSLRIARNMDVNDVTSYGRQARALSQEDMMHPPAANHLDNDLNHVLAGFDEAPYLGEDLCGSTSIWRHSRAPANAFMMEHLQP